MRERIIDASVAFLVVITALALYLGASVLLSDEQSYEPGCEPGIIWSNEDGSWRTPPICYPWERP